MPFSTLKNSINSTRTNLENERASLYQNREDLKNVDLQIKANDQAGLAEDTNLTNQKTTLEGNISGNESTISGHESSLDTDYATYESNHDMAAAVPDLNDDYPILLFPVRIETRFHKDDSDNKFIWIRVFPDQISLENHEENVTPTELTNAKNFWTNIWEETDRDKCVDEWNSLVLSYGPYRSAYLIEAVRPSNYDTDFNVANTSPSFPATDPDLKYSTWTQGAFVRTLPDRFEFTCYTSYPAISFKTTGRVIPDKLAVSIDPEMDASTLEGNAELEWMFNFTKAVNVGMGVKIPLDATTDPAAYDNGFERIVVCGVRALTSHTQGQTLVESIFNSHHFTTGLNILKTGSNTKNAENRRSGFSKYNFTNKKTYALECEGPLFGSGYTPANMPNGKRLSSALGVNDSTFHHVFNADGQDITNAMRMNGMIFPATVGYTMSDMFYPVFTDEEMKKTRNFFTSHVRSRGALPSISIGVQPYGVLPMSVQSRMVYSVSDIDKSFKEDRDEVLTTMSTTWRSLSDAKPVPGTDDPHNQFKDLVGLNPTTTKYYERKGVGPDYMWNSLNFNDRQTDAQNWVADGQTFFNDWKAGTGFNALNQTPMILKANYLNEYQRLPLDIIDPFNPSEKRELPVLGGTPFNFLHWLANSTLKEIIEEDFTNIGYPGGTAPDSLLYRLLRQALLLEYYNVACDLLGKTPEQRREKELVNFSGDSGSGGETPAAIGDSRWAVFNEEYPASSGQTMGDFLDDPTTLTLPEAANLGDMKSNLTSLEHASTDELHLLTNEHTDVVSHRLDSWILGSFDERLKELRDDNPTGVYIGSYGWIEGLKRKDLTASTANLGSDFSDLLNQKAIDSNKGYILAPSLQHAKTAAVLRSGYEKNATSDSAKNKAYEINLSSQRVKEARELFSALKNGQSMGEVLGYIMERKLVDKGYQKFIYDLRKEFPLDEVDGVDTEYGDGAKTSLQRVMDGKKILDSYTTWDQNASEWFNDGLQLTPNASERTGIKAVMTHLEGVMDAMTDLGTAEAVFQTVGANSQAANAIMAGLSGEVNPLETQVTEIRHTGTDVYNRMMLPLDGTSTPGTEWSHVASTNARANAEPVVNYWASKVIGNPIDIYGAVYINHKEFLDTDIDRCYRIGEGSFIDIAQSDPAPANGFVLKCKMRLPYTEHDEQPEKVIFSVGTGFEVVVKKVGPGNPQNVRLVMGANDYDLGFELGKQWLDVDFHIGLSAIEVYVNGTSVYSASHTIDFSGLLPFKIRLGADEGITTGRHAEIYLSNVRVYYIDSSVSATALGELLYEYLLEETEIGDCKDNTINQNHGIIHTSNTDVLFSTKEKVLFTLKDLDYSPIDYIYLTPDDITDEQSAVALQAKYLVASAYGLPAYAQYTFDFTQLPSNPTTQKSFADIHPVIAQFRKVLFNAQPLISSHFAQPGSVEPNSYESYDFSELRLRVKGVRDALQNLLDDSGSGNDFAGIIYDYYDQVTASPPQFTFSVADTKQLLADASEFVPGAQPYNMVNGSDSERDLLITTLKDTQKVLQEKLDALNKLFQYIKTVGESPSTEEQAGYLAVFNECIEGVFGKNFKLLPKFALAGSERTSISHQLQSNTLMHDSGTSNRQYHTLELEDWFQGLTPVRSNVREFDLFNSLMEVQDSSFAADATDIEPLQIPYDQSDDRWMAVKLPGDEYLKENRLAIAVMGGETVDTTTNFNNVGLLIDDWTEFIPSKEENGGLALHFDQPNNQAPQCLILAVTPARTGSWSWADVKDTVNETLDLAKDRAVEYEDLATTGYSHVLPAMHFPFAKEEQTIGLTS